jgi:bifunctional DNA-binding transcriptional regulator/antitoxin component of YhaV-PrlF toxin-antitoxin module
VKSLLYFGAGACAGKGCFATGFRGCRNCGNQHKQRMKSDSVRPISYSSVPFKRGAKRAPWCLSSGLPAYTGFILPANAERAQLLPHAKRERQRAVGDKSKYFGDEADKLRPPLSGEPVTETPQLLSVKPVRKFGHSHVVTLPKEVRSALGIKLGDQITFRKIGRYVFIAVVHAFAVAPVSKEEFRQAREALGG